MVRRGRAVPAPAPGARSRAHGTGGGLGRPAGPPGPGLEVLIMIGGRARRAVAVQAVPAQSHVGEVRRACVAEIGGRGGGGRGGGGSGRGRHSNPQIKYQDLYII